MSTDDYLVISDEALARITENLMDAVVAIQPDKRIIFFNDAAEVMFGYKREEVLGKPVNVVIPERFHSVHDDHVDGYANHGRTGRSMHHPPSTVLGLRKGGVEFPIEAQLSKAKVGNEEIFAVSIRDVTDREDLRKSIAQFIAKFSHELRTPLNAIIGYSDNILDEIVVGKKKILQSVERIRDSGRHLLGLLNDILDGSAIKAGEAKFHSKQFDLHSIVCSAVNSLEPRAATKNLACECVTNDPESSMVADERRVSQILRNLIDNAIKYTDEGGVKIAYELVGDWVRFVVSDTGIGIPEESFEKIFEGYYQIDGYKEGVGLGLSICRDLAKSMGGNITVESELGVGSTFTLHLPKWHNGHNDLTSAI